LYAWDIKTAEAAKVIINVQRNFLRKNLWFLATSCDQNSMDSPNGVLMSAGQERSLALRQRWGLLKV
jgi:hypothetical protein